MEKLTRGDLGMATLIKEFAKPHKHMCSVAERAQHMAKNGKSDEALTLINTSDSHDFSQIKHLFERLINQFKAQRHPMLVVIETDIGRTALMIDSVREVVELGQADIDPIPTGVKTHDLVRGISHRNRQMPVLVFDEHALRTLGVEIDQDEQSLAA